METRCRDLLKRAAIDTLIPEERWHFVRKKQEKGEVGNLHGLFGLIDDKKMVLDHVAKSSPEMQRFWFAGRAEENHQKPKHVILKDWKSVVGMLIEGWNEILYSEKNTIFITTRKSRFTR
jgi:hypothetical protein